MNIEYWSPSKEDEDLHIFKTDLSSIHDLKINMTNVLNESFKQVSRTFTVHSISQSPLFWITNISVGLIVGSILSSSVDSGVKWCAACLLQFWCAQDFALSGWEVAAWILECCNLNLYYFRLKAARDFDKPCAYTLSV